MCSLPVPQSPADPPTDGDRAVPCPAERQRLFEEACGLAVRHGVESYTTWKNRLEARYDVMPLWYWDESRCRQRYYQYVQAAIEWQDQQDRLNRGTAALHAKIGAAL